jgi:hypothetical protein
MRTLIQAYVYLHSVSINLHIYFIIYNVFRYKYI